jgi:hypothetical protein
MQQCPLAAGVSRLAVRIECRRRRWHWRLAAAMVIALGLACPLLAQNAVAHVPAVTAPESARGNARQALSRVSERHRDGEPQDLTVTCEQAGRPPTWSPAGQNPGRNDLLAKNRFACGLPLAALRQRKTALAGTWQKPGLRVSNWDHLPAPAGQSARGPCSWRRRSRQPPGHRSQRRRRG